ncbi:hypothetical protein FOA52_004319 [Chlamydomonas sp. UWO 241]|nr:hypothetical protein FOA52_004319 [Chlamydomonas sp. UWO 241]
MVLKEQGREDLAEEAEAALAVLLDPPPPSLQPALTALEEARAVRIAANAARMASILSGLAQAESELADSKNDLAPQPAKRSPSPKREYSVEAILEHRVVSMHMGKSKKEYLIKWTGYGPEHNSWEPQAGIRRTVFYADYWSRQGRAMRFYQAQTTTCHVTLFPP